METTFIYGVHVGYKTRKGPGGGELREWCGKAESAKGASWAGKEGEGNGRGVLPRRWKRNEPKPGMKKKCLMKPVHFSTKKQNLLHR